MNLYPTVINVSSRAHEHAIHVQTNPDLSDMIKAVQFTADFSTLTTRTRKRAYREMVNRAPTTGTGKLAAAFALVSHMEGIAPRSFTPPYGARRKKPHTWVFQQLEHRGCRQDRRTGQEWEEVTEALRARNLLYLSANKFANRGWVTSGMPRDGVHIQKRGVGYPGCQVCIYGATSYADALEQLQPVLDYLDRAVHVDWQGIAEKYFGE